MKPNFQNPPNPFKTITIRGDSKHTGNPVHKDLQKDTGISLNVEGLAPLPNMRSYLLPEQGHIWIQRDFSSQEIRILAHFEDGALMAAYIADPFLDPHEMARQLIYQITKTVYERKDVKITGFSIIYGAGVPGLASQLGRPKGVAFELREAYFKAMPAAAQLAASTRARGQSGGFITTWGGRAYFTEPSKMVNGRMRNFEYKLLNYLIQGSAGDQTKQVLNDWWEDFKSPDTVFMTTIHDEINASVPFEAWTGEMHKLQQAMDQDYFDVPMRSEGSYGCDWGTLNKMKRKEDYGT